VLSTVTAEAETLNIASTLTLPAETSISTLTLSAEVMTSTLSLSAEVHTSTLTEVVYNVSTFTIPASTQLETMISTLTQEPSIETTVSLLF
jgi:hypothetical protein